MAGMRELGQRRIRHGAVVTVEPQANGLHLRIDAQDAPGGCVEGAQFVQHLGEARHLQAHRAGFGRRIGRAAARDGLQATQLCEGDLVDVARHGGVGCDVRGRAKRAVMPRHRNAICGQQQVGLDEIGALADGETIGLHCVFGQILAGAAMGDDQRPLGGGLGHGGASERDEQGQGETGEALGHGVFYASFRLSACRICIAGGSTFANWRRLP